MVTTEHHPQELLPWYANGTLSGDERRTVESHLQSCARCREELAFLNKLRQQIKSTTATESPGELGLGRLMRDVRREARGTRRVRWQPALAAAASVVIVVQAVMLINLWPRGEPPIAPLGSAPGQEATVQVRFEPRATEAQIREALKAVHGVIVDGPGALGVYRLRLEGRDTSDPEAIARAVEALRARSGVVAHAQTE